MQNELNNPFDLDKVRTLGDLDFVLNSTREAFNARGSVGIECTLKALFDEAYKQAVNAAFFAHFNEIS